MQAMLPWVHQLIIIIFPIQKYILRTRACGNTNETDLRISTDDYM